MKKIFKNPVIVLAAGLLFIAGSGIGATRAAIAYSDSAENVSFETDYLYVDVQEKVGDSYVSALKLGLENVKSQITPDTPLKVEYDYDEDVQIQNTSTGDYDEYVRVVVKKSWVSLDEKGKVKEKDTRLDPSFIKLNTTGEWLVDDTNPKDETMIFYCKKPVAKDEAVQFLDSISFSRDILNDVTTVDTEEKGVVRNVYGYNDKTFEIEIRVDAVQAHNAEEAILGAWGVHATVDGNGNITAIN